MPAFSKLWLKGCNCGDDCTCGTFFDAFNDDVASWGIAPANPWVTLEEFGGQLKILAGEVTASNSVQGPGGGTVIGSPDDPPVGQPGTAAGGFIRVSHCCGAGKFLVHTSVDLSEMSSGAAAGVAIGLGSLGLVFIWTDGADVYYTRALGSGAFDSVPLTNPSDDRQGLGFVYDDTLGQNGGFIFFQGAAVLDGGGIGLPLNPIDQLLMPAAPPDEWPLYLWGDQVAPGTASAGDVMGCFNNVQATCSCLPSSPCAAWQELWSAVGMYSSSGAIPDDPPTLSPNAGHFDLTHDANSFQINFAQTFNPPFNPNVGFFGFNGAEAFGFPRPANIINPQRLDGLVPGQMLRVVAECSFDMSQAGPTSASDTPGTASGCIFEIRLSPLTFGLLNQFTFPPPEGVFPNDFSGKWQHIVYRPTNFSPVEVINPAEPLQNIKLLMEWPYVPNTIDNDVELTLKTWANGSLVLDQTALATDQQRVGLRNNCTWSAYCEARIISLYENAFEEPNRIFGPALSAGASDMFLRTEVDPA